MTPSASATPFLSLADEAGAHAFVVAYFAELNRAYATGDVSRLKPYRLDTCICVRAEREIVDAYSHGGRIEGVDFAVLGWAWGAHGPAFARTAIAYQLPVAREEIGRRTIVKPAVHGYFAIDLRRQAGHWVISDVRGKEAS